MNSNIGKPKKRITNSFTKRFLKFGRKASILTLIIANGLSKSGMWKLGWKIDYRRRYQNIVIVLSTCLAMSKFAILALRQDLIKLSNQAAAAIKRATHHYFKSKVAIGSKTMSAIRYTIVLCLCLGLVLYATNPVAAFRRGLDRKKLCAISCRGSCFYSVRCCVFFKTSCGCFPNGCIRK